MVVRSNFDRSYWVIAEIVSFTEAKNGHLYLEVAEKDHDILQAKVRANLWSNAKKRILSEFEYLTKQTLKKGMKVLLNVSVDFHPIFGMSLNILEIDSNFSLGEIERQKQETLIRLESEGLLDFNKQHVLPEVIQSIAIISSETAAGYQDFIKQLEENPFSYRFKLLLFQANMQGENASSSIIKAIDDIEDSKKSFDAVVLIRGGGSSLDLSCFDEYPLAVRLATCYFPVLTGIGHERDQSIADEVAHTRLKTPTAVAEFLVSHNRNFENKLLDLSSYLSRLVIETVQSHQELNHRITRTLSFKIQQKVHKNEQVLDAQKHAYQIAAKNNIRKRTFWLEKLQLVLAHDLKIQIHAIDKELQQHKNQITKETLKRIDKESTKQLDYQIIIPNSSKEFIQNQLEQIDHLQQITQMADPINILKKGFTITRFQGKLLKSTDQLKANSIITTEFADGEIESSVQTIYKNEQETNL